MRLLPILLVLLSAASAAAGVLVVPDDEPDLRTALRNASRGDTVQVRAGFYEESDLRMPSGVSLVSLDADGRVIIQAEGEHPVLTAAGGANTAITGVSFQGGATGVRVESGDVRLVRCRFLRNGTAVDLAPGSGLWMEDCELRDNETGIAAADGTTLNVSASSLYGNGTGIRFAGAEARLYRNSLKENDVALDFSGKGSAVLGGEPTLGNDIYQNNELNVRNAGVTITGGHNFWGRIRCELIERTLEGEVPILPFTNFRHDSTFVECPASR